MKDDLQVYLNFSDQTVLETDGIYSEMNRIMTSEWPHVPDWMIRTSLTIDSEFGSGSMVLHLYSNKDFYIIDYNPSMSDVFYNPDIQYISCWAQDRGWNTPKPHNDLAKTDIEFWKHFWLTLLVDSDYLDKIYGLRPQLVDEVQEEEEENTEKE